MFIYYNDNTFKNEMFKYVMIAIYVPLLEQVKSQTFLYDRLDKLTIIYLRIAFILQCEDNLLALVTCGKLPIVLFLIRHKPSVTCKVLLISSRK